MSKSSNPFLSLYKKYLWQYKCDGVGDNFTEQLAFKLVGELTMGVLLSKPAMMFWEAMNASIQTGSMGVKAAEEALLAVTKAKETVCGLVTAESDGWFDLLKGYITPARVASESANEFCYVQEKYEVEMKRALNIAVREQVTGILSYITTLYKTGGLIETVLNSSVATTIGAISVYRHDLVCAFAAMWKSLWDKVWNGVPLDRVKCSETEDYLVGNPQSLKL